MSRAKACFSWSLKCSLQQCKGIMAWDWSALGGKGQQSSLAQGDALVSAEKMLHIHSLSVGCFPQEAHSWLFRHGVKLHSVSSICMTLYIISAPPLLTHVVVDMQKNSSPQSTTEATTNKKNTAFFLPFFRALRDSSPAFCPSLPPSKCTNISHFPQKNSIPPPKAKIPNPPKIPNYQEGIS